MKITSDEFHSSLFWKYFRTVPHSRNTPCLKNQYSFFTFLSPGHACAHVMVPFLFRARSARWKKGTIIWAQACLKHTSFDLLQFCLSGSDTIFLVKGACSTFPDYKEATSPLWLTSNRAPLDCRLVQNTRLARGPQSGYFQRTKQSSGPVDRR